MDILEYIENRAIELAQSSEFKDPIIRAAIDAELATLTIINEKIREEFGWQPGPPPADPEHGSQWELDWGEGEKYLCEVSKFDAGRMIWESNAELPPDDNDLSRVVRHRRIMPAPGEV